MRQFTAQEIQEHFDRLPEELREAITSAEINDKIEAVAKKNGLMIDQIGELVDEVGLIMLGLAKSADFVNHIMARCGIDRNRAVGIANDINMDVFNVLRQYMRNIDEKGKSSDDNMNTSGYQKTNNISSLERAGEFRIVGDDEEEGKGKEGKESKIEENDKGVGVELGKSAETVGTAGKIFRDEGHTDVIADHLLGRPVSTKQEKVVRTVVGEKGDNVGKKDDGAAGTVNKTGGYGIDPYREQV